MSKLNVALNQVDNDLLEDIIDFSGGGDSMIITGSPGTIIRIYKIFFLVAGSTGILIKDNQTALVGVLDFSANEGVVLDFDTKPWFTLGAGDSFLLNSSNAVQVSGRAYYTQAQA